MSDAEGSTALRRCRSAPTTCTWSFRDSRTDRAARASSSTSARRSTVDFDLKVAAADRDDHGHGRLAARSRRPPRRSAASSTSAASRACRSTAGSSRTSRLTIPGVGLGFHSDPTKSTQYSPQINGGNGRNVNYQIDGGDNNDDTVGGLLQLFPLEAIQEFNFQTARSKAEYGRSNGGVMNIVTKSGTNQYPAELVHAVPRHGDEREDRNGEAQRGRKAGLPPLSVRRLVRRTDHAGTARISSSPPSGRSRTRRSWWTRAGLFPSQDGVFATPVRENLLTVKVTANLNADAVPGGALRPKHQLAAVRRGPAGDRRTTGATARTRSTRSTSITTGCSAARS